MLCDLTQNLTLLSLNVVLLIGAWLKSFSINAKFSSRYWSGAPCNLIKLPVETDVYTNTSTGIYVSLPEVKLSLYVIFCAFIAMQ